MKEKEYTEREALRNALYEADAITMEGVKILNQFPASDVETVRHGEWVYDGEDWFCNRCNRNALCDKMTCEEVLSVICPHCGARMNSPVCSEVECEPPYGHKSDCELYNNGYCGAKMDGKGEG